MGLTPVLSWGGLRPGGRARSYAAEARTDGALATYEGTVLRALEETETAFVGYAQRQRLASIVRDRRVARAAELARVRTAKVRSISCACSMRSARAASRGRAGGGETDLNTSVVLIYKALGGGWEAAAPQS